MAEEAKIRLETVTPTPTPISLGKGRLTVDTVPEGARIWIDGVDEEVNTTGSVDIDMVEFSKKVKVALKKDYFTDKEYSVTVRRGKEEYFLKVLTGAVKICGTTKKETDQIRFSFMVGAKRYKCGDIWTGTGTHRQAIDLEMLNQLTGNIKELTTDATTGKGSITITYADDFFGNGKNKLVVSIKGTANRIKAFKTITVKKGLGFAYSPLDLVEPEWEEEYPELEGCKDLEALEDETGIPALDLREIYEKEGAICFGGKDRYNIICCEKPDEKVKKECDEACKTAILRFLAGL